MSEQRSNFIQLQDTTDFSTSQNRQDKRIDIVRLSQDDCARWGTNSDWISTQITPTTVPKDKKCDNLHKDREVFGENLISDCVERSDERSLYLVCKDGHYTREHECCPRLNIQYERSMQSDMVSTTTRPFIPDWYKALNEGMSHLAAVQAMEQGSYPGQCTATWHDCMVI